ncbi:actin-related protein 2/3 complex subunit 4 [Haematococcus lacustris]|uniref:Actin-related protein 2/3 complex subunit 4 n=1 Tax=Haematococcus lacustris TaxID=44745 RepID=A0A699ZSD9_HAELA|nr:actin-related protein 2/3 complex subunit 4 [Haematococcus lacustris]
MSCCHAASWLSCARLVQRADALRIIRRVPMPGYDVSFLITAQHLAGPGARQQLVDWLVGFVMECDAEINGLKLDINARGRAVATSLLRSLAF